MNTTTLGKMVGLISTWRKEMNEPNIPLRPNAEHLRSALKDLDRAGMPEGLAAYFVLVSEYLFRIKTVDKKDTENLLIEIETKLNTILSQRAVYHIVQALEPSIRKSILEEGRKPIPFQTNLRPALIDLNPKQRGFYGSSEEMGTPKRITLGQMAPNKSGPIPWAAPWVAGSAIKKILEGMGAKAFPLSFNLVLALHDEGRIEDGDFRKRDKTIQGPALDEFISWYQGRYKLLLRNEEIEVGRKPLPWEEIILIEWEPEKPWGFGDALFTHNPDLVCRILGTYSTTRKKKPTERGKK